MIYEWECVACNAIQRSHSCPPVRKTHSARCYFSHVCTPEWQLDTLLHQESGFLPPNLLQPALGRMSLLTRVENLQSSTMCSQVPQLTSWGTNGRRLKVGWVGCLLDHMLLLRLNKRMIRTRSVHHHFSLLLHSLSVLPMRRYLSALAILLSHGHQAVSTMCTYTIATSV